MIKDKLFSTLVGLLAVTALLLAACGPTPTPPPATEAPTAAPAAAVKVGAVYPLTGDLASTGESMRNAFQMGVDEVNAAGGIKSLGGAPIELVFGDSQGKPEVGASEVERLIQQEGVVMVVGCYQSSVTKPASQAAERLSTPFLVDMAIADVITERDFKYVFRIAPKNDWYTRDQVAFIQDLEKLAGYKVEKVAILHEDTDFGTGAADGQKKYLEQAGIEMVVEVAYPASAADLTTEVAKVQAADPDLVLTTTYLNDAILIAQARQALGMTDIPFLDTAGGTIESDYIKRLGDAANGTLTVLEFSKYAPGSPAEVNARYLEKYGIDLSGNSSHSYVAGWVIADVLERAGSVDKDAIRDALAATKLEHGPHMILPAASLEFGEDGQNKNARLYIVQIQDGELIPVWPAEFAAAEIQLGQ
jgi:branched-chain amino acid transport system substrate-binding protein